MTEQSIETTDPHTEAIRAAVTFTELLERRLAVVSL